MASEQSFADRHGRGQLMQAAIAEFTPAFAPSDVSLEPSDFNAFLAAVEVANDAVGETLGEWGLLCADRQAAAKQLKLTGTRVVAFLRSNAALSSRLTQAKRALDRLRGAKPRRPKAPAPPEGETPAKLRNSGDQSYADVAQHFKSLLDAVTGLAGYAPTPVENPITLANLSAALSAYRLKNAAIGPVEVAYRDAVRERLAQYDGEGGLRDKMKAIKDAAKAQYGQSSGQYLSVKGIRV